MAQKIFVVEGRQFRTESDYACAKRDKETIDRLRQETDFQDRQALETLLEGLRGGRYHFLTLLGQDFRDEVETALKNAGTAAESQRKTGTGKARSLFGKKERIGKQAQAGQKSQVGRESRSDRRSLAGQSEQKGQDGREAGLGQRERSQETRTGQSSQGGSKQDSGQMDRIVAEELRKREKRRKLILLSCSVVAVVCLGYFSIYSYYDYRTRSAYEELSELKERPAIGTATSPAATQPPESFYTLDEKGEPKEVLEEYKNLLLKNKKLIGWVKIEDTNIDYPVMQTVDNVYYLDHNMDQQYDRNGTIFMDKDCDVLKPSTNFILYGHHMQSGRMFGQLDKYKDKSFYEKHPYISFDTIYEKGTYQIMYVFRSKVYKETEIVFKYYQFIDANGEQEFRSYMEEMAALSLYDTGVSAQYGDQLLTLSTCDYQETDGRFVVVAKKIVEEGS